MAYCRDKKEHDGEIADLLNENKLLRAALSAAYKDIASLAYEIEPEPMSSYPDYETVKDARNGLAKILKSEYWNAGVP